MHTACCQPRLIIRVTVDESNRHSARALAGTVTHKLGKPCLRYQLRYAAFWHSGRISAAKHAPLGTQ